MKREKLFKVLISTTSLKMIGIGGDIRNKLLLQFNNIFNQEHELSIPYWRIIYANRKPLHNCWTRWNVKITCKRNQVSREKVIKAAFQIFLMINLLHHLLDHVKQLHKLYAFHLMICRHFYDSMRITSLLEFFHIIKMRRARHRVSSFTFYNTHVFTCDMFRIIIHNWFEFPIQLRSTRCIRS